MTDEAQRIIALEQALFALLAAGAVRGIPPNGFSGLNSSNVSGFPNNWIAGIEPLRYLCLT